VLFGLAVATLVTRLKAGLGVFRTVFTCRRSSRRWPASSLVFLQPRDRPVNQILGALGLPQPLWFNDPQLSKPSLVLLGLWASAT
jgi:multiple sugar transport system permease protein